MRAIICSSFGLPNLLELQQVEEPVIDHHQVLISVEACGVNFPDILMIQDKYQFKPKLPFSPGGEVCGVVEKLGKSVRHLQIGDRVVALCGWGGFAEKVAANANRVFKVPTTLNPLIGATTLYTYGTSYHALNDRAQLQSNKILLVLGAAGGVGLAAVELGKLMGATVVAAASSPEKLAICKNKGADYLIDYSHEDLRMKLKEITGDKNVDVIYDPVGGKWSEAALRSIAWKGRYLVMGFTSGEIQQLPANLPLLKGASIMGVFWGSFAEREPEHNQQNTQQLIAWLQEGKIKQHIHKIYSLQEAPTALHDLIERKVMGKAVVVI
ncbi:MAG: NADPH:quinone oxidoreductase family protein [Flammeovirgaceae bacterium]